MSSEIDALAGLIGYAEIKLGALSNFSEAVALIATDISDPAFNKLLPDRGTEPHFFYKESSFYSAVTILGKLVGSYIEYVKPEQINPESANELLYAISRLLPFEVEIMAKTGKAERIQLISSSLSPFSFEKLNDKVLPKVNKWDFHSLLAHRVAKKDREGWWKDIHSKTLDGFLRAVRLINGLNAEKGSQKGPLSWHDCLSLLEVVGSYMSYLRRSKTLNVLYPDQIELLGSYHDDSRRLAQFAKEKLENDMKDEKIRNIKAVMKYSKQLEQRLGQLALMPPITTQHSDSQ